MTFLHNTHAVALLQAVVALAALTFAVWVVATVARVRAMTAGRIHPQKAAQVADLHGRIAPTTASKMDNYNHLFEAPTVFYAVALACVLAGQANGLDAVCAWGYVLLRLVHTVIHTTINRVTWRFYVFVLSWLVLAGLIADTAIELARLPSL